MANKTICAECKRAIRWSGIDFEWYHLNSWSVFCNESTSASIARPRPAPKHSDSMLDEVLREM